jgi:transposase-like protein
MHTLEERTRAIELYIKYGLKATATIRELGYACRVQLAAWYGEYLREGRTLPERTAGCYTAEQKRTAVEHYLGRGCNNAYTRRELAPGERGGRRSRRCSPPPRRRGPSRRSPREMATPRK